MPVVCSRVRYVLPAVAGSKRQVILRKIFFFSPAKIQECIFPPAKCVRRSYGKLLFHPWLKVWEINCRPDLSFGNSPLLHSQHLSICTPSHSSSIPPPKDPSNIFIPFYGKMLQGCSRAIINNGAKTKKDGSIRKKRDACPSSSSFPPRRRSQESPSQGDETRIIFAPPPPPPPRTEGNKISENPPLSIFIFLSSLFPPRSQLFFPRGGQKFPLTGGAEREGKRKENKSDRFLFPPPNPLPPSPFFLGGGAPFSD